MRPRGYADELWGIVDGVLQARVSLLLVEGVDDTTLTARLES